MPHLSSIFQQANEGGCVCACRGWLGPSFWDSPNKELPINMVHPPIPWVIVRGWCIRLFFYLNAVRLKTTWNLGLLAGIAAPWGGGTIIPAKLPFKNCCWDYSEDKANGTRNGNGNPWRIGSSSFPSAPSGQMLFDAWKVLDNPPDPEDWWEPGNPPPINVKHSLLIVAEVFMVFVHNPAGGYKRTSQYGVRYTPSACAYY